MGTELIKFGRGDHVKYGDKKLTCNTEYRQINDSAYISNISIEGTDYDNRKLYVNVRTNHTLQMQNIECGSEFKLYSDTSHEIIAGVPDTDGWFCEEALIKPTTITNGQKELGHADIDISTNRLTVLGLKANTINVRVSTCKKFKLFAKDFTSLKYSQSTTTEAYICIPDGSKINLVKTGRGQVICNDSIVDSHSPMKVEVHIPSAICKVTIKAQRGRSSD